MLNVCKYSDAYVLGKQNITVADTSGAGALVNSANEKVIFKSCVPLADCISEITNTQIDNAKEIDVVMNMYNLVEYSENYSQRSGSLWLYYRDQPAFDSNNKYY